MLWHDPRRSSVPTHFARLDRICPIHLIFRAFHAKSERAKNLFPGADRELEIDEAIYNCRTVIAVITPLAVASQEQRQEWARADEAKKHPIPAVRRPVRLPRRFLLDQPVDLSDGVDTHAELTKLINKLGCSNGGGDLRDVSFIPPLSDEKANKDSVSDDKIIHIDEARAHAMTLLRQREYTRMIQWSDELDDSLKANPEIYTLRAVAQDALGNVKAALEEYAKAIGITPDDANLYVQRGRINVDVGNIREADEDFEKALRLNPELKDVIDTETSAVVIFVRHVDQLPMPLFDEIEGRSELASAAKQALETGQGILLHGMGGIGKTALSTAIAQEYLSEGRNVLWVNVGSARLETLLNAIGQEVERELDERKTFNEAEAIEQKAAYIAERLQAEKPLLVLDDAWNPEETKQFLMTVLPAQYPIIVTTRRTDFEDIQGIIKFDIPELLPDAAVNLYQAINGAEDDIQAIIELCKTLNYHPLAIRLAALKAKSEEQTSAQLLEQIGASSSKNSIRAIFDVVIGDIGQVATNVFIVIGALPVTRVTDEFMAITLDNPVAEIAGLLRDLASLGLINPTITSDNEPFYAVHDLTYAYAHDLLVERNRTDELEHRVVKAACLYVERFSNNSTDDFKKLTVEKPTLIASITRAKSYQDHTSIYALVDGLLTFLDYQGYSIDHLNVLAIASEAAETQRDQRKQARYWIELANISAKLGRYKQAIQYFEMALAVIREFGDRRSEGSVIGNLANVYVSLGESDRAIEYYETALNIARKIGDRGSEATTLSNIGAAWDVLGEKRKALEFYEQALPIRRVVGDRRGEATTLSNIGAVWDDLGEKQKALDFYKQSLPISREIGDRQREATNLTNIGKILDDLGDKRGALQYYEQSLPLFRDIADLRGEGITLNNIGEASVGLGLTDKARGYYEQALALFNRLNDTRSELNVLKNIQNLQPEKSQQISVYLSYARGDDDPDYDNPTKSFMRRLYNALTAAGFDVWWDRVSLPSRSLTFTQKIEDAIRACERFVLVVAPGIATSDYVQAEYNFALKQCKPITPILRAGDYALIPKSLGIDKVNAIDCRVARAESAAFTDIAGRLRQRALIGKTFGVQPMPRGYITREKVYKAAFDALQADAIQTTVISAPSINQSAVTLFGVGGVGKSTLASALAHDCQIRRHYRDGIIWIEVGQTPSIASLQASIGVQFGDSRDNYRDERDGALSLSRILQGKTALIVLDDVWDYRIIDRFPVMESSCKLLVTTRSQIVAQRIKGTSIRLGVLTPEEGAQLIARWTVGDPDDPDSHAITDFLGGHTLAVTLAAAQIAYGYADSPSEMLELLQKRVTGPKPFRDLTVDDSDKDLNLGLSLSLSYDALNEDMKRRFRALGVFAVDDIIDAEILAEVWGDIDEYDFRAASNTLLQAGLLDKDIEGRYMQHHLLQVYARALLKETDEYDSVLTRYSNSIRGGNINIGGQQLFAGNITIGGKHDESDSEDDE